MATLKKTQSCVKTNYRLMQVKSIAICSTEHSEILSTFIKPPFSIKIFVLSLFERPFCSGFTVGVFCLDIYLENINLILAFIINIFSQPIELLNISSAFIV